MRTILLLLSVLFTGPCIAADTTVTFDMSFNLDRSIDKPAKAAAISRIAREAREIAVAVVGADISEGLKLSVRESPVPNGFSTHIECYRSLSAALGDRLASVHRAYIERFEQLVISGVDAGKISDPSYMPLPLFLTRYGKKG